MYLTYLIYISAATALLIGVIAAGQKNLIWPFLAGILTSALFLLILGLLACAAMNMTPPAL